MGGFVAVLLHALNGDVDDPYFPDLLVTLILDELFPYMEDLFHTESFAVFDGFKLPR